MATTKNGWRPPKTVYIVIPKNGGAVVYASWSFAQVHKWRRQTALPTDYVVLKATLSR